LSEEEKKGLEQLVRRRKVGQQIALRGRIIMAAGQGQTNSEIANDMRISINTVQRWRNRWAKAQTISYEDISIDNTFAN